MVALVIVGCIALSAQRKTELISSDSDRNGATDAPTPQGGRLTRRVGTVVSQVPLPSENTPLASTLKTLTQLSDSGSAAASMRLYKDLKKCDSRQASLSVLNGIYYHRAGQTDTEYEQQIRLKSQQEPEVKKALAQLDNTQALCDGIAPETITGSGEYLRDAALQNDPQGMVCYASSYELGPPYLSDAWFDYVARWRLEAPSIAQQALNAGEPGILAPLIEALMPDNPDGLKFFTLHEAVNPDPQMAYALLLVYARIAHGADLQHAQNNLRELATLLQTNQLADAQATADSLSPRFQQAISKGASLTPCPDFLSWPGDTIGSPDIQ